LVSGLFLEVNYHIHLYHSRRERIIVSLIFLIIGSLWDSLGIIRGHWSFPGTGLIGIKVGVMPIEEYLFMLIIPFWILTVYKLMDKKIK
jgi:lycopene cyclase domain-containing protein